VQEAVNVLVAHRIGALVVVDEADQPVGIISERDIVRELARSDTLTNRAVSDAMTKNLITASSDDDLASVGKTMIDKRFRHVPVVDEGNLVGIISIGDVLKTQLELYKGQIETLQISVTEGGVGDYAA
jgi:CBS domain-containing protein